MHTSLDREKAVFLTGGERLPFFFPRRAFDDFFDALDDFDDDPADDDDRVDDELEADKLKPKCQRKATWRRRRAGGVRGQEVQADKEYSRIRGTGGKKIQKDKSYIQGTQRNRRIRGTKG